MSTWTGFARRADTSRAVGAVRQLLVGFIAWAGCLPDSGSVVVTRSNTGTPDIELPKPLVLALESAGLDAAS
jgi:hypothetical protein